MAPPSFTPLETGKTSTKRPSLREATQANTFHNLLQDQLTLPTWLAIGAAAQALLFALPIKRYYLALPVFTYLLVKMLGTILIVVGIRPDPVKAKMLETKFAALVPDREGNFRMGTQGDKITVFLLGFRNHHHLGMFAPGFKEIGQRAGDMFKELEDRADELGLLGISYYGSTGHTTTNGEIMTLMYFKSNEDVIRYANGPLHREAWSWYNKAVQQYPHLGIMHELYEVPAGNWEGIYKNIEPTCFAATKHKIVDASGREQWVSPVVDATRGKASSTAGRLA